VGIFLDVGFSGSKIILLVFNVSRLGSYVFFDTLIE